MDNNLKIFFSNMGYARGIDGSLQSHIQGAYKHFYCARPVQEQSLAQLDTIIKLHEPDLCCLVEIEEGTSQIRNLNHLHYLLNDSYTHYDIANKYGEQSVLKSLPLHIGRSNGFMAKQIIDFEKLYFNTGSKRLIYKIDITDDVTVLFTHFSLNYKTRQKQLDEMSNIILSLSNMVILLADFNIMTGFSELETLMERTNLRLLNDETISTFRFHNKQLPLDLCLSSPQLENKINLDVIDQPFSDHDALLLTMTT